MKRIISIMLTALLICTLTACSDQLDDPSTVPESSNPAITPERETYLAMDIFSDEFNPFGMDWPFTVFEASFSKGSDKFEGKSRFVLSMTGEGNMYACIAYLADISGLGLDEDGKFAILNDYLKNGGFYEFEGTDDRIVTIRQANPNDDRYEYVEADGSHGASGGGCVIDISFYVDEPDVMKYTHLIQDNYDLITLSSIGDYFDTTTDFNESGITVNLYKDEVVTSVVYYVQDTESIRQDIVANVESDWWEWGGNQITWISYNDMIGNNLTFDIDANAITIDQKNKDLNSVPISEGSLTALGFVFDEAGICGVYEDREPHYKSVAIARPEWGEFTEGWNIEFMDTDIKGYSLRITFHASENKYRVSLDKDGKSCSYEGFFDRDEFGWEYPNIEMVHEMFGDAFDSEGKNIYYPALDHFEQYVHDHFDMSIDELYLASKQ
ncbi:MAG: hypothetical protein PHP11_05090 [Erysipelotrichaceae bacterium]|nr:hypothetical protein [Erysipelotrichaceae bacterium]